MPKHPHPRLTEPEVGLPPLPEFEKDADKQVLMELAERLLLGVRVHATRGFQKGRCLACDFPHSHLRPCRCPHHDMMEVLAAMGRKVEM